MQPKKAQHTPGPWEYIGFDQSLHAPDVSVWWVRCKRPATDSCKADPDICQVFEMGGAAQGRHEAEANARLIASAPQLAEAALAALEYLQANQPKGNIRKNFSALNHHENGIVKPLRAALRAAGLLD